MEGDGDEVGEIGQIGGGEERPLLSTKKRDDPPSHHTQKKSEARRELRCMSALVKESLKCVGANAAQVWSKDVVACGFNFPFFLPYLPPTSLLV